MIGLFQIFHILHFFSFFKKIEIIENFYDYISDDTFILVNFLSNENKSQNYKLGLKVLLYSIFNPGGGFLISSVVLMDSCNVVMKKIVISQVLLYL